MITAEIIADSINPRDSRLTTFLLTYPRFIHSEFMTHRAFSRNAASSRAIPFEKATEAIRTGMAMPEYWGAEKKGMQSGDALNPYDEAHAKDIWEAGGLHAIDFAKALAGYNVHKSLCNRLTEPFSHITVIATAQEVGLENFFHLRASPMAQPEFQVLAFRMLDKFLKSKPDQRNWGDWHIPWRHELPMGLAMEGAIKVATARAARTSYTTHDSEKSIEEQIALHDSLAKNGHWSPFEHCACAMDTHSRSNFDSGVHGPSGWMQYRKKFSRECAFGNVGELMNSKPDWIKI
jgi:thymidylate synthase ThyX